MFETTYRFRHLSEWRTACWTHRQAKPKLGGATTSLSKPGLFCIPASSQQHVGTPWMTPWWLFSAIFLVQQQVLCYQNTFRLNTPSYIHKVTWSNKHTEGWAPRKLQRLAYLTASGHFMKWWSRVWVCPRPVSVSSWSPEASSHSMHLTRR